MSQHQLLSSLLQGFLFPPGMLLVGVVLAAFAGSRGRMRLALAFVIAPALITTVFSLPIVGAWMATPIEQHAVAIAQSSQDATPRTAVVLGGALGFPSPHERSAGLDYKLSPAANRVIAATRLWRDHRVDKLVFAGASARGTSEAELMARFAADLGAPRSAMLIEPDSRTTYENAVNVAKLLKTDGLGGEITLITSAIHLPRAMQEFRCAGLSPVGVAAEFEALNLWSDQFLNWIPSAGALDLSRRALKEYVGGLAVRC